MLTKTQIIKIVLSEGQDARSPEDLAERVANKILKQPQPQFLLVDIGNGYTIKYDGYRDEAHWTLLRTNGGRILDGSFSHVIDFINKEHGCPKCGERNCEQHGYPIKEWSSLNGTVVAETFVCTCGRTHSWSKNKPKEHNSEYYYENFIEKLKEEGII